MDTGDLHSVLISLVSVKGGEGHSPCSWSSGDGGCWNRRWTQGSSKSAVRRGQIPQSSRRRAELGLKLRTQAPGQEGDLQESMQRTHFERSRAALDRWKVRQGLPPLRRRETSATFDNSFHIPEFLLPEFQLTQNK